VAAVRNFIIGLEEAKTAAAAGEPRAWQSRLWEDFRPGSGSLAH